MIAPTRPIAKPQPDAPAFGRRATIYCDGSNYGQPGPAGYGVVVIRGDHATELSGPIEAATNNGAELRALVEGLAALNPGENALIISDSQYIINGATRYRLPIRCADEPDRPNSALWVRVGELSVGRMLEYKWVKGHAGDAGNERADQLAGAASLAERDRQNAATADQMQMLNTRRLPQASGKPYVTPPDCDDVTDEQLLAAPLVGNVRDMAHWLVRALQRGTLPDQPFDVARGIRQIKPLVYYSRLRVALLGQPIEALRAAESIKHLYDQFRTGADVADLKMALQVLHRETPKMVCVIFKANGKLIALHEATATQAYGPLDSPGGVDRAAIEYALTLGVQEWHHWTKPNGPLWVTTMRVLLNYSCRETRDDRDRHFLPAPFLGSPTRTRLFAALDSRRTNDCIRPRDVPTVRYAAVARSRRTQSRRRKDQEKRAKINRQFARKDGDGLTRL